MKIATDNLTGDEWHFNDGRYFQFRNGEQVSYMSQKNFPNPWEVWNAKVSKSEALLQRSLTEEERNRLKPREYIFKVWEHKDA